MKQLLIFCFAFSFLAGCNKSTGTQSFQNSFRMVIDGTRMVTADLEIKANNPRFSNNSLTLYGRWSTGELSIYLGNITLGETIVTAATGNLSFKLFDPGQTGYYSGWDGFGGVIGSGKINILEVSDQYVKGTFQFISGPNNNIIRTITNGEFHIKRDP